MLNWKPRVMACVCIVCSLTVLNGCGTSASPVVTLTPTAVMLLPGQTFQFNLIRSGNTADPAQPTFSVNGVINGSASVGTITPGGLYTAPAVAPAQPIIISVPGESSSVTVTIFDPNHFASGSVVATQNPLVATYSILIPVGTSAHVRFGTDTSYGFPTSSVAAPTSGGQVTVLVAGMRASTAYHMQGVIDLIDGSQVLDKDQTFTTGAIPVERIPAVTAQQFGGTQAPGIELLSLLPYGPGKLLSPVVTDLAGNVIWYYDLETTDAAFPIKLLPNGHMMLNAYPVLGQVGPNEIREIDLAGNIINRITLAAINQALTGVASFQIAQLHHDFAVLPNGHVILLASYTQTINNVTGIPAGTQMQGDVLIDWDPQRGPVWTWSTFDHLDLTHAPYGFSDWTHANAVVYSPDDGNLILSMRNQNWVIKIDYRDGAGDGSVLWRFGPDGDFTLPGQEAPIEWNYGQHFPTLVSPNSAGVFSLMFFNNGNNRLVDDNDDVCGSAGFGACYSSVPIFQVDENARTASLLWENSLLPAYSICCGDALQLPNGDAEFDVAYDVNNPNISSIEEITPAQQLLWKMDIDGQLAYRGFRIPSLYPGQVWPAAAAGSNRAMPAVSGARRHKVPTRTVEQLP